MLVLKEWGLHYLTVFCFHVENEVGIIIAIYTYLSHYQAS